MKVRPVEAKLFLAVRRTDRLEVANSRFRNIANAPKNCYLVCRLNNANKIIAHVYLSAHTQQ